MRAVSYSRGRLAIIDQRRLPAELRFIELGSATEVARALKELAVRGAPNIGVAAGYGLAVEAWRLPDRQLRSGLLKAARVLVSTRPTAVNLSRAVARVGRVVADRAVAGRDLRRRVEAEAKRIAEEETRNSLAIARCGAGLVPGRARVMTVCSTGALAAPGLGTALGVVSWCKLSGKRVEVLVSETRPLLQGARLTAFELHRAGIETTLMVDSAAATVMPSVDLVIVGADRIARNGDTANKVGTLGLAILARHWRKPFYVAAPSSSFDPECRSGAGIVVEERPGNEVRRFGRCRIAMESVAVFNPAFDVTPGRLVTAFITERGLIRPPFGAGIARMLSLR